MYGEVTSTIHHVTQVYGEVEPKGNICIILLSNQRLILEPINVQYFNFCKVQSAFLWSCVFAAYFTSSSVKNLIVELINVQCL